jgi:hypothetical protein
MDWLPERGQIIQGAGRKKGSTIPGGRRSLSNQGDECAGPFPRDPASSCASVLRRLLQRHQNLNHAFASKEGFQGLANYGADQPAAIGTFHCVAGGGGSY